MKNKATILAVLALLGVSVLLTGCPRHHRHFPRPHHLQQEDLQLGSLLQNERQDSVASVSLPTHA